MRTSIRKATAADAAGVLECLRLAFEPYRERYTPAGYADTVVGPQNIERRLAAMTVLVATARDGEVIGTIGFQRLPTGEMKAVVRLAEQNLAKSDDITNILLRWKTTLTPGTVNN